MKNFININDVDNIQSLIDLGLSFKKNPFLNSDLGKNKVLGLLFFNSSLRTRLSTQKAALNLGLDVIVMNVGSEGWQLEFGDNIVMDGDKPEHIKEAAAVIGQYCDILGVRSFAGLQNKVFDYKETVIESFRKYAKKPILNLESATGHPCQALADLITIQELKKVSKPKVVLTWAPHVKALPQAVPNSFAEWVLAAGYDLTICNPEGYDLDPKFTEGAIIIHDQEKALENAEFVYAKNWSSYESYGQILPVKSDWKINQEKLGDASFMHCLPVRRGLIVDDDVLDSAQSVVIQQAGNRVWSAQAVLKNLLANI